MDQLKISLIKANVRECKHFTLSRIKIGYIVNQSKFVNALKKVCEQHDLEVDVIQYTVNQQYTIRSIFDQVDILIMGEYPDAIELIPLKVFDSEHPLSIISKQPDEKTWHSLLYKSYRVLYYPKRFRKSLISIYGYPDLSRSWLS